MTATAEPELWERNATVHADERLIGPRDGAWWYTGANPDSGDCPGLGPDGRLTSLAMPDLSTCGRADVLAYFDNSWALTEALFAGLQGAEAFYRPPGHGLRHPMAFYYGHPAVLYVNKLRVAGLLGEPVNEYLEEVLETGVDEMSWDDMSKNEMLWPSVSDIKDYRATVYGQVRELIENTDFAQELGRPIGMRDPAWAIFLGFEHERIHLETSSVLIREMPLRLVSPPAAWPAPAPDRRTTATHKPAADSYPANGMVAVAARTVPLGKPVDFPSFGWDNEYGTSVREVEPFSASKFMVSNGEYHEFVADGGYRRPELWSAEGEKWRRFGNTKEPRWWVKNGPTGFHAYRLRTIFEEIDMPWDWPVCVNYHEAKAFCAWKGEKDGTAYALPTEAQFRVIRDLPDAPGVEDDPVLRYSGADFAAKGVNVNLAHGSEFPVDTATANGVGVHDSAGNVWAWSEDLLHPYDGFETHPYYEDFSIPCFDGRHHMILGGCYVSTGDQASVFARYHFRPHFLQQTGIRLISSTSTASSAGTSAPARVTVSETVSAAATDAQILLHFGTVRETFDRTDHPLATAHGYPKRVAAALVEVASRTGTALGRVLDVQCAVGGATFALAALPGISAVGVDSDSSFVEIARTLAGGESVAYTQPGRGEIRTRLYTSPPAVGAESSVAFEVAEPCDLPASLGLYDAVILGNALDRLGDPEGCLRQFTESDAFLGAGGLLLVASPWSEYSTKLILSGRFDLVSESDEPGVLRTHSRDYEYFDADVTVWRKR
ncbi:5-histidylcysteine sulfoxide synthase [Actinokineospora guangxiensis]|uniref:5-histidylcysteine sulfoxide synthase n=1 Tax=Actinokineospora guangxiensis TaxID=1490288 RepID=A0ABW0EQN0_9PSEU